ncbi:hypothetical protein Ahy_B08g090283 [Arachis hypogaea]|uniref:Maf-like protein n=2 Tax=Magnoliopsida TaxID=3398 RepID=A0A444XZW7_ARAHY|nr:hypothetical protein Ahy_B08g090283 [Arachis hypogaea]
MPLNEFMNQFLIWLICEASLCLSILFYATAYSNMSVHDTLRRGLSMAAKNPSIKIILGSSSKARRQILAEMGYEFTIMTADIDEKSIRKEKPEDLVMALAEAKLMLQELHSTLLLKLLYEAKRMLDNENQLKHDHIFIWFRRFFFLMNKISVQGLLHLVVVTDYAERLQADAIVQKLLIGSNLEKDGPTTLLITADTVVVYQGIIREKPTSEKEAREFIKGYSGSHAGVVGSVMVTNLATRKRSGGWDSAEVYFHEIPDEVIDNLIDDGVTFRVAGGLMLEHPLTLPFVDAVVGSTDTVMGLSKDLTEKLLLEVL